MSQSFKCCQLCYEDVESIDAELAQFWLKLCGMSLKNRGFYDFSLKTKFNEELNSLELYDFVTLHETDQELIARVNGLTIDCEYMPAFCINLEDHAIEKD